MELLINLFWIGFWFSVAMFVFYAVIIIGIWIIFAIGAGIVGLFTIIKEKFNG